VATRRRQLTDPPFDFDRVINQLALTESPDEETSDASM